MREIKFRGKIKKGYHKQEEWEYFTLEDFVDSGLAGDYGDALTLNHIDFKTIGQYTGLKDKNGKEIYEGDVVKYYVYPLKNYFKIGVIKFRYGSFYIDGIQEWISDKVWVNDLSFFNSKFLEVIGNIYDNPELLERGG